MASLIDVQVTSPRQVICLVGTPSGGDSTVLLYYRTMLFLIYYKIIGVPLHNAVAQIVLYVIFPVGLDHKNSYANDILSYTKKEQL